MALVACTNSCAVGTTVPFSTPPQPISPTGIASSTMMLTDRTTLAMSVDGGAHFTTISPPPTASAIVATALSTTDAWV